jgi:hypothetical protein
LHPSPWEGTLHVGPWHGGPLPRWPCRPATPGPGDVEGLAIIGTLTPALLARSLAVLFSPENSSGLRNLGDCSAKTAIHVANRCPDKVPCVSRRGSKPQTKIRCKPRRQTKTGLIGVLWQCVDRFWNLEISSHSVNWGQFVPPWFVHGVGAFTLSPPIAEHGGGRDVTALWPGLNQEGS